MGASCAITAVCGLALEAKQYVKNKELINFLVLLQKQPKFKQAIALAKQSGDARIILDSHKDGSLTLKSMLSLLTSSVNNDYNILSESEINKLNSLIDIDTIVGVKLSGIADTINKNHTKNLDDKSIGELSYDEAVNIATLFNLLNAVDDKFIAIVEHKKWGSDRYKVKIVKRDEKSIEKAKEKLPKYAAIQAALDFFRQIGIDVRLDQMNPDSAGNEIDFEKMSANDVGEMVKTLITICTNGDSEFQEDIPQSISRDIAVAAANVLINTIETNQEFRESIGYNRLKSAVERYQNSITEPIDKEEFMKRLITEEIENRLNNILKNNYSGKKAGKKFLKYLDQRLKWLFRNITEFCLKKYYGNITNRWAEDSYKKKRISLKQVQIKAQKAVNEMFKEKNIISNAVKNDFKANRLNLRKYTAEELKNCSVRHNESQKVCIHIEKLLQKHAQMLSKLGHTQALTRFENMMATINEAFALTNAPGAVSSNKNIVSRAVTQVALLLNTEIQQLNNDLNALNTKMLNMVPDYTNPEYMSCVNQLIELESRYKLFCEIRESLSSNLGKDGILNPKVRRLGSDGVEESNLKNAVDEMLIPLDNMADSFNTTIDKINIDLLEQIIGTDELNIICGKMIGVTKVGRSAKQHNTIMPDENTPNKHRYFKTRKIIKEVLQNPALLKNSWFLKLLGSSQNSVHLLAQMATLAMSRANTEAHNRTQLTLLILTDKRRKYSDISLKNIIERDIDGIPTGNLVRPIDYNKYELELRDAEQEWGDEFVEKYKNRDLTNSLKAILWKNFRQEKFNAWNKTTNPKTGRPDSKYKKQTIEIDDPFTDQKKTIEIYAPNKDIYPNYDGTEDTKKRKNNEIRRWDHLTPKEKELSNLFFALKYYSDDKLDDQGSGCHKIPMFKGGIADTFWGNNVAHLGTLANNTLKRSFLRDIEDDGFGATQTYFPTATSDWSKTNQDVNDRVKRIPLYGIRKLDNMKNLSHDLYSSYLAYDDMSNNYNAKSRVEMLLSNVSRTAFLNLDKMTSEELKAKTSYDNASDFRTEFEHIVDKEIYGLKKDDILLGTFGIRMAKIMNAVGRVVTTVFLGGNIHSSFVNLITGYNEIIKEAGVGEYINKRDLILAMRNYTHHTLWKKLYPVGRLGLGNDNENAYGLFPYLLRQPSESPSLVNEILRDFDFTERYVQDIRRYSSLNTLKFVRNINILRLIMLPYEVTDHWMQAVPLMALLHHEKVYTRPDEKGEYKQVSLLEAMYPEYHRWRKEDKKEPDEIDKKTGKVIKEGKIIKKGRRSLVEKPSYINTGNKFGIFYKTAKDAEEGERLIELLNIIHANIVGHRTEGKKLQKLTTEHPKFRDLFAEYKLGIPTTIHEYENAQTVLNKELEKKIYNNADLAKFQLKAREIVNRMHGVYDARSKGSFNRSLLGATMLSMKNYAIGLINKRFMQGHYNILLNKWDEGTIITATKVLASAWTDGLSLFKLGTTMQTLLALITPYMGKHFKGKYEFLNINKRLEKIGFSEALINNLKRGKLEALRVFLFGFLNHVIYGLGEGWLGGYDDDDDEKNVSQNKLTKIELILKELDIKSEYSDKQITKQSIEDGSAFERWLKIDEKTGKPMVDEYGNPVYEYGPLYSEVSLRLILEDGGADISSLEKLIKAFGYLHSAERDFVVSVLIPMLDEKFPAYKGTGGINSAISNAYDDWCDLNGYYYYDKKGNRKRGWKGSRSKLFKSVFTEMLKEYSPDGKTMVDTRMQRVDNMLSEEGKKLKKLQDLLDNTPSTKDAIVNWFGNRFNKDSWKYTKEERESLKRKEALKQEILDSKLLISTLKYIKNGYNIHMGKVQHSGMESKKSEFFKKYDVSDIKSLRLRADELPVYEDEHSKEAIAKQQLLSFLKSYEKMEANLTKAQKSISNKEFEKEYFKLEHPNVYYTLGVVNYLLERGLLEQESFLPGADLLARKVGGYAANTAANLMNSIVHGEKYKNMQNSSVYDFVTGKAWNMRYVDDVIKTLPEMYSYHEVPTEPWKLNAFNEVANLAALPAATGAFTSITNLADDLSNWAFGDSKDNIESQMAQLMALKSETQNIYDESERRAKQQEIQNQIDELLREYDTYYAKNNSGKLRKGQHKASKAQSFIPYWRSFYMMGLFSYLDYNDPEGGWNATKSFKNFYFKEDK